MPRLIRLTAACLAVVLTVSACTQDDPKPNFSSVSPTPTVSSSSPTASTGSPTPSIPTTGPNVSPGEVAPTEPASARANDSEGALAFIAYYYKMTDWVFATSSPSILDPFFAATCSTCRSAQAGLAKYLEGGNHFVGGRITIHKIALVNNDRRQAADFAITGVTDVGSASIVSSSGTVVRSFPASTGFQLTDWVRYTDGRWQIVEERKV